MYENEWLQKWIQRRIHGYGNKNPVARECNLILKKSIQKYRIVDTLERELQTWLAHTDWIDGLLPFCIQNDYQSMRKHMYNDGPFQGQWRERESRHNIV